MTAAQNVPARGNVTNGVDRILSMPRCHLTQPGAQSIANAGSFVTFTSAFYDTDGFFNPSLPTRATIRTQGVYDVKQDVEFTAGGAGASRQSWVQVNGTNARYARDQRPVSGLGGLGGCDTLSLMAGDYVELFAYQDSGGALLLAPAVGFYNAANLHLTLLSLS